MPAFLFVLLSLLSLLGAPARAQVPPAVDGPDSAIVRAERNERAAARGPDSAASAPAAARASEAQPRAEPTPAPRMPSEFERLATLANGGQPVWRFGAEPRALMGLQSAGDRASDGAPPVPADYPVQPGDELTVHVWGSVDGEWRQRVDRSGRIVLPRVGPVRVQGVPASELEALLRTRLERVYRAFELAVAVSEPAPIRIQVTGFVERPGDLVLPGLATVSRALARVNAPASGGSLRRVKLLREGREVAVFDLYSLLAEGSRQDDRLLLGGDVLHVEAIGAQVAVLGSVNRVAVFEFLPGQTVAEVLQLAGGFSAVAERGTLELERMNERDAAGVRRLQWPRDSTLALADGDLLRVLSQVGSERPTQLRSKRVRVEGEVQRPGDLLLPPEATLADAVAAAGGHTAAAFVYGTELRRERVRLVQEANYLRALQELEAEAARLATTRGSAGGTAGEGAAAQEAALRQLLGRMRARRPEGRLVLDLAPAARTLPALALEDGDTVRVPPRSQSVGVFGSVFNAGSFVFDAERSLGDYLGRAGGPTGGAEADSVFVVRANGSVVSARQGGWWNGRSKFDAEPALPGDTLFVPERLDRVTFVQGAKDWTQILYQLGVGLAALLTLR